MRYSFWMVFVRLTVLRRKLSYSFAGRNEGSLDLDIEEGVYKDVQTDWLGKPNNNRNSTHLDQLHQVCEAHEHLEHSFPSRSYGNHAMRLAYDETTALAVRNIRIEAMDLPLSITHATVPRLSVKINTTESQSCTRAWARPEKVPQNAACFKLQVEDLELRQKVTHFARRRYPKLGLIVALAADMDLSLYAIAQRGDQYMRTLYAKKFRIYMEGLQGGVIDRVLEGIINSETVQHGVLMFLNGVITATFELPRFQSVLLGMELFPGTTFSVKINDVNCKQSGVAFYPGAQQVSQLCLSFAASGTGTIRSGQLAKSAPTPLVESFAQTVGLKLDDEMVQVIASAVSSLSSGLSLSKTGIALNNTVVLEDGAPEIFATVDAELRVLVPQLLEVIAGMVAPKGDSRIESFLSKHPGDAGWVSFGLSTGGERLPAPLFLAGMRHSSIELDASASVDFVSMPDHKGAWRLGFHSGQSKDNPMSMRVRVEKIDCSFDDGSMLFDICEILGHDLTARIEHAGSVVLTEDAELLACLAPPCPAELGAIESLVHLSSKHVPKISFSSNGTLSVEVKVSDAVKPLFMAKRDAILKQDREGPWWLNLTTEMLNESGVATEALLKYEAKCGLGIGAAIQETHKAEWKPQLRWTLGDAKRKADIDKMAELESLPGVAGKTNKMFTRFDEEAGDVNVIAWSQVGVDGELSVRAWHPDLTPKSSDTLWFEEIGYPSPTLVKWILELGGPEPGTMAKVSAQVSGFFLTHDTIQETLRTAFRKISVDDKMGAHVELNMRMLLLQDGSVKGCFGSCCTGSVQIGGVELMTWGSPSLSILNWALTGAISIIGGFIPELLGNFLPNLLEIPVKMGLAKLTGSKGSRGKDPGRKTSLSFTLRVSSIMESDLIQVRLIPEVRVASGLGWSTFGSVQVDQGVMRLTPPMPVRNWWMSLLAPGIARCRALRDKSACGHTLALPVTFVVEPQTQSVILDVKGLKVRNDLKSIIMVLSQSVAQRSSTDMGGDSAFCLAGLKKRGRELDMYPPLSREPFFDAPLPSIEKHVRGAVSMSLGLVKKKAEAGPLAIMDFLHELSLDIKGQLGILNIHALLLPWINDAGVADFGFVHVHSAHFMEKKSTVEVHLRCGRLVVDGEAKVDMTDPSVKISKQDQCLVFSRPEKVYTLCSDIADEVTRLESAAKRELERQEEFRSSFPDAEQKCKLPRATSTVLAVPPKAAAFTWKPVADSQTMDPTCKHLCASNVACAAFKTLSGNGGGQDCCRFFGPSELDWAELTPGMWSKAWLV